MDLGEGTALNEALRENLFMLLVSIMNQIPILVIGTQVLEKLGDGSLAEQLQRREVRNSWSRCQLWRSSLPVLAAEYTRRDQGRFRCSAEVPSGGSRTICAFSLMRWGSRGVTPLATEGAPSRMEHLEVSRAWASQIGVWMLPR